MPDDAPVKVPLTQQQRDMLRMLPPGGDLTPATLNRNTLPGDFIALIAAGQEYPLRPQGLTLRDLTIQGRLDLSWTKVTVPLRFIDCVFDTAPTFEGASMKALQLRGCHVPALNADNLTVEGWLLLDGSAPNPAGVPTRPFECPGGVTLRRSTVHGQLDTSYSNLQRSPDSVLGAGYALDGEALTCDGEFVLKGATVAGLYLAGATVGGNLDARTSTLTLPSAPKDGEPPYALVAESIKVKRSVHLEGARITGPVWLVGAQVDGQLLLRGVTIDAPDAPKHAALAAARLVTGRALILDGLLCSGDVRLEGAKVGDFLRCTGAKIVSTARPGMIEEELQAPAPVGARLVLEELTTGADVRLDGGLLAGTVNLAGATVGENLTCDDVTLTSTDVMFNGQFMKVANAFTWTRLHAGGTATFYEASVGTFADDASGRAPLLDLRGFTYRSVTPDDWPTRSAWLERQVPHAGPGGSYSSRIYQQLEKMYRDAGNNEAANETGIVREGKYWVARTERAGSVRRRLWQAWRWYLRIAIGYGYRPADALRPIAVLLLLATALVFVATLSGGIPGPKASAAQPAPGGSAGTVPLTCTTNRLDSCGLTLAYSIAYGVELAFPVVTLGQQQLGRPPDPSQPWGVALAIGGWVATLLGWLLTTTLVAGIAGLVKSK